MVLKNYQDLDGDGQMNYIGQKVIRGVIKTMTRNIQKIQEMDVSILNAARDLFSYFGYKKTSVDDIAKKARVAKGTIYNYYRSKEELFQKVFQEEGRKMIAQIREAVNKQKTPQLKLREMVLTKIQFFKEFTLLYEIDGQRAELLLPFLEQARNEITIKEINIIEEIMEEGVNSSVFQKTNISVTAKAMALVVRGLEMSWTLEMDIKEATAEFDSLLQILFQGLESR